MSAAEQSAQKPAKWRRVLRIVAWTAGTFVALVLVLVAVLLIVGNTDSGRALIANVTSKLTKGHVQLTGIHGSFPSSIELDRLELRDDNGVWLYAERVWLRWRPRDLLADHIQVDELHVGRLHIERPPLPDKNPKPTRLPSIPRSDISHVSVDVLELGSALAGAPVSLFVTGRAHLNSLLDATAYAQAHRTGGVGHYELHLQFDPQHMNADLTLQEPANGPLENLLGLPGLGALNLHALMQGTRTAEALQLSLDAGPMRGRLSGTANLVDLAGDLTFSVIAPAMTPYPHLSWQSVDLQGRWRGSIHTPYADGHLKIASLQIPGGASVADLSADLAADSTGLLQLHAITAGLTLPGPAPALFRDSPLTVDADVRLNEASRPVNLTARHRLLELGAHANTAGERSARLDLKIPDLAPFAAVGGQQVRGSATVQARITFSGASTHLTADANGSIDGGQAAWAGLLRGGNTHLQTAGTISDREVAIDTLQLTGPAVSIAASGTLGRNEPQAVEMRVEATLPDLTRAAAAASGDLKLTGKVGGTLTSFSVDAEVATDLSIHGSPRGKVAATVHAKRLPDAPEGTLAAEGMLDAAPLTVNVALERATGDAMHVLIRHADWKSAHAEGDVTSGHDLTRARGNVRVSMTQLADLDRLLGNSLRGSLAGNAVITGNHAKIRLEARDIETAGNTINAQLDAEGATNALTMTLAAQSPAIGGEPADARTSALLNLERKVLRVDTLEATYHGQTLKLLTPAALSFADGLTVDNLKLAAQDARLELGGRITPELDVRASLRQLKPELVNAFVPRLLATGTVQADAEVKGSFGSPTGTVSVDATGMRAANDAGRGLPGTDIHVKAQLEGDTANVDASLAAGQASKLELKGAAPLSASGQLQLKLTGSLDLGLLNPLLEAGGRHVTGALAVDTAITGAADDPGIGGTVRLTKGSFRDYAQGTNLSDINGQLSGSQGTLHIDNLTAKAAPGTVSIEGSIGVLQPKIPVELKLTARDAQPIANNIITANVNADIRVSGTARERLDVAGTIDVKRADVEIPSGLPPNVAVLDVRRPGKPNPPPPANPLVIGLDVTVDAPRQILVKGRGLDAELGGQIRIRGTTDEPQVSGGFELQRGFFTLASSKLTFSNGTVTFNGAGLKKRIDPSLDFTAQSQVADVTAIVKISGLADAPRIELSSTPDLPQDEILARLLFGVPAAQLSALQVVQIGAALATLTGGGGLNPVAKIQKALGLDRLSVAGGSGTGPTGSQNSGASIEAGRYVSSRVFVAVKESTSGASQLAVDVDLTKHLKLQTRLGNGTPSAQGTTPENDPGSSVGLAYQFEY